MRIEIQRAGRGELFRWRVVKLMDFAAPGSASVDCAIYAETAKEARALKRLMATSLVVSDLEIVTCWCGARGTAAELFSRDYDMEDCGGFGSIDCNCGGDGCVCHNHGEIECLGCEQCDEDPEHFDEDDNDGWCDDEEADSVRRDAAARPLDRGVQP